MTLPDSEVVDSVARDDLDRSTRAMTVVTALSRGSGFLRIVVFGSVFGKTFLANTYQNANTIPNILFELFALGALQAVLVPTMVRLVDVGDDDESHHVAGAVLGVLSLVLSVVVMVGIALGPQIMRLLVDDVADASTRRAEVALGATFLWFFMPQVLFYGMNVVATAVLNAHHRFALPVFAPFVNNVVVIATYVWFDHLHGSRPLTLHLTTAETWVVAGGTTVGVVLFCALPVVALVGVRFPLRPNLDWRHPALGSLLRDGAWAAVFLGLMQITQLVVLRVANREAGGVTVWQWAFILFTLPHALFSVPIMTTRYPCLSRQVHSDEWRELAGTASGAVRSIGFMGMLSAAVLVAAAVPATRLMAFGGAHAFASEIASATAWFAPGIAGFGLLLFFTRVLYAFGDARTPALVNLAVVAVSSVVMLVVVPRYAPHHLISGLAATFGGAQLIGGLVLGAIVASRLRARPEARMTVIPSLLRSTVAGVAGALLGAWIVSAVDSTSRAGSLSAAAAAALVASVAFVVVQWAAGGPAPRSAVLSMGALVRGESSPREDGA